LYEIRRVVAVAAGKTVSAADIPRLNLKIVLASRASSSRSGLARFAL